MEVLTDARCDDGGHTSQRLPVEVLGWVIWTDDPTPNDRFLSRSDCAIEPLFDLAHVIEAAAPGWLQTQAYVLAPQPWTQVHRDDVDWSSAVHPESRRILAEAHDHWVVSFGMPLEGTGPGACRLAWMGDCETEYGKAHHDDDCPCAYCASCASAWLDIGLATGNQ